MDLFEVLEKRHSVRAFQEKGIEKEKMKKIFKAVNSAPSAGNLQAYKVLIVKSREKRNALTKAALGQGFVKEAPVVLVFCAVPSESTAKYGERGNLYSIQDATIAATYAQLVAVSLGLASVWVGAFNEEQVKKALDIKTGVKPIALIPIGYPAEEPAFTPRKNPSKIIREIE